MSAPYPLLGNPVPGYIMPEGTSWTGGTFGVTSSLADHLKSGRAAGTDLARYPRAAGDPVFAMRAGVVYQKYIQPYHNPPQIGDGALIVRIRHKEGNTGYAHLQSFAAGINIGAIVKQGQRIGTVGHSGTAANSPHLHTHWQDNAGNHHEVYWQMEQSRSMQFNQLNLGGKVNIRLAPGLGGAIWGSCRPTGIYRGESIVAAANAVLGRRRVSAVYRDGYRWMPIQVPGQPAELWVAQPFVHFV